MKWYTHAAVGANVVWVSIAFTPVSWASPFLVLLGAFAALLPDVEAENAKIHHIAGGFFAMFRGVTQHRMIFHSLLATAICAIFGLFLEPFLPGAALALGGGYLSHCLIDGLNYGGVGYLTPFDKKRYHLVPRRFQTLVGGKVDTALFFLGIVGVVIFFLVFQEWLRPFIEQVNFENPEQY